MRCDQFVGLSVRANVFIKENCKTDKITTLVYRNGLLVSCTNVDSTIHIEGKYEWVGMYDDLLDNGGHKLPGYLLKDDQKIYEMVQTEPWSSGPMFFTHLVDENGVPIKGTSWTNEEIDHYL